MEADRSCNCQWSKHLSWPTRFSKEYEIVCEDSGAEVVRGYLLRPYRIADRRRTRDLAAAHRETR